MKKIIALTILGIGLAACQTTTDGATGSVSRDAVLDAGTPSQLRALGARPLSGSDIQSELIGQTLDEGSWTWNINSDGTASSRADNGSWTSSSTWDISGNQFCRQSDSLPRKCSDVFELGGIYRFSDTSSELAG